METDICASDLVCDISNIINDRNWFVIKNPQNGGRDVLNNDNDFKEKFNECVAERLAERRLLNNEC